ncbi:EamA family transporter [Microcoleus sp. bin38.metabat.b11b12b14.051]|uniref:EamA family transporter n=1 Tax=Microcoleus sp. bin38.metabat.b11b12b14.051 TaxID=2742709 RepID=UPI0026005006|nr:EamA family transporter [Microcoleus sp. bin38.metabat.b11b12b14.051]
MVKIPNWLIYALICSLLYGFWGFLGKLATKSIDYKTVFVYETIGAILTTLFIFANSKDLSLDGNIAGIVSGLLIGVCGTAASLIFLKSIETGPVISVISITSLYPVISVFLSYLFLKEAITIPQFIALILAIISVILSSY